MNTEGIDQEEIATKLIHMAAEIYLSMNIQSHFLKDCEWEFKNLEKNYKAKNYFTEETNENY